MKYYCYFILIILATALVSSSECLPISQQKDIPCEIITPEMNCSSDANITNLANSSQNYSIAMSLKDPGCTTDCLYNFSFNLNSITAYDIVICSNYHRTIYVVEDGTQTISSASWVVDSVNIPTADEIDAKIKGYFTAYFQIAKKYLFFVIFGLLILFLAFKKKKLGTKELPIVVQEFKK